MTFPDPSRLVTLAAGYPGLRGPLRVQVTGTAPAQAAASGATPGAPTLDFVSSDETLDHYSEIISASGWRLDSYRRNPVFQNAHQHGDIIFTLG